MVIKLGPVVLQSLTRISKFYDPSDSEHKFHKTRIDGESPCQTYSMMGSLKLLYNHLRSLGTIVETLHFLQTVQVL